MPRAEVWAERISAQTAKSVQSLIEVGRLLDKAKSDLVHGEWCRLFEEKLIPFSRQTAFKLISVATHPVLSNVAHAQHLPPAWGTLYELTRVPEPELRNALKDGLITPEMQRQEVRQLLPAKPRASAEPDDDHWMLALAKLRTLIERSIADWPSHVRLLVPEMLRSYADELERTDVDRGNRDEGAGEGVDPLVISGFVVPS